MKLIDSSGWGFVVQGNRLLYHRMGEKGENLGYCAFDGEQMQEVSETEYFRTKYGPGFQKTMEKFGDRITDSKWDEDGFVYVSHYLDPTIYKYDSKGNVVGTYVDSFDDEVYDIEVQGDSIWLAYPTSNLIKRYSFAEGQEEVTLGERFDDSILSYPESIVKYGDFLYVSDMGSHRILKVHLETLEISEYMKFDESVWEYARTENHEYVRLQSGIYLLER